MKKTAHFLLLASLTAIPAFSQIQQQPAATADIKPSGIVISGRVSRVDGEPVAKATVTLQPVTDVGNAERGGRGGRGGRLQQSGNSTSGGSRTTTTGNDGGFSFTDVQPGSYRVLADREGFIQGEYGQKIFSGPGVPITVQNAQKVTSADLQLIQGAAIAGQILDEDDQPVAGIQVQALRYEYRQGQRVLLSNNQTQTDDRGAYRMYWFEPGEYVVSAAPNAVSGGRGGGARGGVSESGENYAATYYYPGGIDPLSAVPVTVAAGFNALGIDFRIRPFKTGKVNGKVLPAVGAPPPSVRGQQNQGTPQQPPRQAPQNSPPGNGRGAAPANNQNLTEFQVALLPVGAGGVSGGGGRGPQAGRASVSSDGTFEITRVVPGTYEVVAYAEQDGTDYTALAPITVSAGEASKVILALKPSVDLPGRIVIDGQQTPAAAGQAQGGQSEQFRLSGVQIRVVPVENFPGAGQEGSSAKDDGSFLVDNIRALHYRVQAQLPGGAYLIAATYGGEDALNGPIEVAGSDTPLELRIGLSPGRIEGVVMDRAHQPYAGATVTLAPSVRTRLDLYRSVVSDASGRFTITNQAPGSYKIFAWEQIPQGAWQDPLYLERFEDQGRTIHVDQNGSVSQEITLIPMR